MRLLLILLLINIDLPSCVSDKACSSQGNRLQTTSNESLFTYAVFPMGDRMECLKMCLSRTKCVGVNMDKKCVLYRTLPNKRPLTHQPINLIPRSVLPKKLVGQCADFKTKDNEMCVVSPQGKPVAVVTGCVDLPTLDKGVFLYTIIGYIYPFNQTLEYKCSNKHQPLGTFRCNPSGSWSKAVCIKRIKTCGAIKRCNPDYGDGEYFLWIQSRIMKIYCHKGKMFITLPESFGKITYNKTMCLPKNPNTGIDECGTTTWKKVKVHTFYSSKVTLLRYTDIFYEKTCKAGLAFASTIGCPEKGECQVDNLSSFHVNLTGTGFKWTKSFGGYQGGQPKSHESLDGHVVDVTCTGSRIPCGWCLPYPASSVTSFSMDDSFEHDPESAVVPLCGKHKTGQQEETIEV